MEYDYSKLIGRIIEVFGTRAAFADAMGISEHTLSMKLKNKAFWKQPEMSKAAQLLNILPKEIQLYFFTPKVQAN